MAIPADTPVRSIQGPTVPAGTIPLGAVLAGAGVVTHAAGATLDQGYVIHYTDGTDLLTDEKTRHRVRAVGDTDHARLTAVEIHTRLTDPFTDQHAALEAPMAANQVTSTLPSVPPKDFDDFVFYVDDDTRWATYRAQITTAGTMLNRDGVTVGDPTTAHALTRLAWTLGIPARTAGNRHIFDIDTTDPHREISHVTAVPGPLNVAILTTEDPTAEAIVGNYSHLLPGAFA